MGATTNVCMSMSLSLHRLSNVPTLGNRQVEASASCACSYNTYKHDRLGRGRECGHALNLSLACWATLKVRISWITVDGKLLFHSPHTQKSLYCQCSPHSLLKARGSLVDIAHGDDMFNQDCPATLLLQDLNCDFLAWRSISFSMHHCVPCHLLLGNAFCGAFKLVTTELHKERFHCYLLLGSAVFRVFTLGAFARSLQESQR